MKFLQSHETKDTLNNLTAMYVIELSGLEIKTIRAALNNQSYVTCEKDMVSGHINDYIDSALLHGTGIKMWYE